MRIYPEFINLFPRVLFPLDRPLHNSKQRPKAVTQEMRGYYLSELFNFGFDRRWSRGCHRGTFRCDSNRLHLLLELINLILYSSNPTPLPTQIASPQSVHKQPSHHKWMNESKCSSLQNAELPSNSKCILHSNKQFKSTTNPFASLSRLGS